MHHEHLLVLTGGLLVMDCDLQLLSIVLGKMSSLETAALKETENSIGQTVRQERNVDTEHCYTH